MRTPDATRISFYRFVFTRFNRGAGRPSDRQTCARNFSSCALDKTWYWRHSVKRRHRKLIPVSDWGKAVEVRREGDRDSIGFRKEAIYRFDQELFESFRAAFDSKDRKTLTCLWNSAEHGQ